MSFKDNFIKGIKLIFTQNDQLPWNAIEGFGTIYLISLPFTIIGMFNFKHKAPQIITLIWLGIAILMMGIVDSNINRVNIVYFPLIILTFLGLKMVCSKVREFNLILKCSYLGVLVNKHDFPQIHFYDQDFVDIYGKTWSWVSSLWVNPETGEQDNEGLFIYPEKGKKLINQLESIFSSAVNIIIGYFGSSLQFSLS